MNSSVSDSASLLVEAIDQKLYGKLVEQLEKDFKLANVFMDLPKDIPPEGLRKMLHEKIYLLLMEKFTEYLNLLYVIDVPEKAFKKIQTNDPVEVAGQVSFLILKRELQKIILRQKYGG